MPPLSLVIDGSGIYYDPNRESALDRLILSGPPPGGAARVERLVARIAALGITKYNLGGTVTDLPEGRVLLVPGQVEDDASIRLGAGEVRTNLALLERTRAANPDACIVYKPHPDVEAGLRPGRIAEQDALRHADAVLTGADPATLLRTGVEVWTITSLLGSKPCCAGFRSPASDGPSTQAGV